MSEYTINSQTGGQLTQQTLIDTLLDEREYLYNTIVSLDEAMTKYEAAMSSFETALVHGLGNGNRDDYHYIGAYTNKRPNKASAIRAMDCGMWNKLFNVANLEAILPADIRKQWYEAVQKYDVPEFTFDNIKSGLGDFFLNSEKYFAQKVDGVFQALSKTHVTNNPSGFRSRMIFADALLPNSYGLSPTIRAQFEMYLSDFIRIICNLCNYPEPPRRVAYDLLMKCYKHETGTWHTAMGNMFRIRVYKKGTVHIEVHPDLAGKLNQILATLYPLAIASQLRKGATKAAMKEWKPIVKPISAQILRVIKGVLVITPKGKGQFAASLIGDHDKHVKSEVYYVLEQVGYNKETGFFDYDPRPVINEILETGLIPDSKSFQYYPTPETIANKAAELLDALPTDQILEPSAGTGNLLKPLEAFKENITAIEISPLRCTALKSKGYKVIEDDFMRHEGSYDKIIMNPPYSDGRWHAHVIRAASMLKPKGRIVAILPSSATINLDDSYHVTYGPEFENEFRYTSISVKLVIIDKL